MVGITMSMGGAVRLGDLGEAPHQRLFDDIDDRIPLERDVHDVRRGKPRAFKLLGELADEHLGAAGNERRLPRSKRRCFAEACALRLRLARSGQGLETLRELFELFARFPEDAVDLEMVGLRRFEHELDTLDEIVHVADELLLQDQVPLVDLFHAFSVQAEHAVVVSFHAIEPRIHVFDHLVVEANLCGVHLDLAFHHGPEGEAPE